MNKSYCIVQKLNYKSESLDKQTTIDRISDLISTNMNLLGFSLDNETPDYVFSVGGDGTMMHSMHKYTKQKSTIIGIYAGNLGFLTPFEEKDLPQVFELIKSSNARIEQRSILKYSSKLSESKNQKQDIAINEYAITATSPNDMIEFSIEIEHRGHLSKAGIYRANAVLISGPCGSTAYNMNAGGAIVDPSVKCMQILLLAPTTLGQRPIIIGKNSTIHVKVKNKAHVYGDGVLIEEISDNNTLSITLLPKESNILVPNDWNFYSVLSKKLLWNNGRDVNQVY